MQYVLRALADRVLARTIIKFMLIRMGTRARARRGVGQIRAAAEFFHKLAD